MTMLAAFLAAALAAASAPSKPEIRNVRISSPKVFLSREKSDSPVQVVGQFKVEMSFAANRVRKPVARLCCLCDIDGTLWMNRVFLDRPDTAAGMGEGEILQALKAAGLETNDARERESLRNDPAKFTPYLREVGKDAYASAVYGSAELGKGFFRLGKAKTMPKLVLFRIELWQNGSLVAKYESPHTGLGGYGIPNDWHVWKKYPQKFQYSAR